MRLWIFILFLLAGLPERHVFGEDKSCSPAREYITVMEFLRSRSEWKVPEKVAQEVAKQVAEHCPGSAGRLFRVAVLLSESGVGTKDALFTGMRVAQESDELADRFVAIFKRAYLQSGLDLDIVTSHRIAAGLSVDYGGTLPAIEREFDALVDFCSSEAELAQSKPRCARFASELLTAAKDQEQGVGTRFKELYSFLTSKSGAQLPAGRALVLAQEISGAGQKAGESFIEGFRYATSPKGLSKSRIEAVGFARELVLNQLRNALEKGDPVKNPGAAPVQELRPSPKS